MGAVAVMLCLAGNPPAAGAAPVKGGEQLRRIGPALSDTVYDSMDHAALAKRMEVVRKDMARLAARLKKEKDRNVRSQLAREFREDIMEFRELKKRLNVGRVSGCEAARTKKR